MASIDLEAQQGPSSREGGDRPVTYSSPAILDRRRRILDETRKIIANQGVSALNMSDVGQRAGVAKRTLYNAFQTRERMIAAAIQDYLEDFVEQVDFSQPAGTMVHSVERLTSVASRNRRIRNYIRAIMTLYFSSDLDESIWQSMHQIAYAHNIAWISALNKRRQLQPWVTPEALADDLVRFEYATINDWAQGRIADDEIVLRLVRSYLTMVLGAVRGTARTEIIALLKDIDKRKLDALPVPPRRR